MSELESLFQSKVLKRLKEIPDLYYHKHQAGSIRGIADIIICYKGRFFALELKRSKKEAEKKTGRIVLQRYTIGLINKAGGIGRIVHPDNWEEVLQEILGE